MAGTGLMSGSAVHARRPAGAGARGRAAGGDRRLATGALATGALAPAPWRPVAVGEAPWWHRRQPHRGRGPAAAAPSATSRLLKLRRWAPVRGTAGFYKRTIARDGRCGARGPGNPSRGRRDGHSRTGSRPARDRTPSTRGNGCPMSATVLRPQRGTRHVTASPRVGSLNKSAGGLTRIDSPAARSRT